MIGEMTIGLPVQTPEAAPASVVEVLKLPTATPAPRPLTLRIGFDMQFDVLGPRPTPMLLMLFAHPQVAHQLDVPEQLVIDPNLPLETFTDGFGNRVGRLVARPGPLRVACESVFRCAYEPEPQPDPSAHQHDVAELPPAALPYLLGSRYCEVDRLSAVAWDLFGKLPPGGERVLAINQWVFKNVTFGYRLTRPNKTALDTFVERTGVCRDMMHLAITFCRAMNIPARYATGYLGDIDADPDPTPMDFSAFYEVYLDGRWWPMDARHGKARVGRVLMARGRDATDVALITSFGPHKLTKFTVLTDEVPQQSMPLAPAPLALSA